LNIAIAFQKDSYLIIDDSYKSKLAQGTRHKAQGKIINQAQGSGLKVQGKAKYLF